jgi:hypothetical protein
MEEVKRAEKFVAPTCSGIFNMAWVCLNPASQFNQIYRKGELENCPALFGDWERCIYSSLGTDEQKKQVYNALVLNLSLQLLLVD